MNDTAHIYHQDAVLGPQVQNENHTANEYVTNNYYNNTWQQYTLSF